ncbi:IscS subfamily cysteine desulfurase [Spirulina sp. CCNP1310]|uniref:cysteine desulfurase family protein n=1 Tax=Spirulina sp. CCNP1310 TaxID=3110249 RepID=UPI002B204CB7|nr:IscS subfamily cysteine desulfurase [Spirulina sp. CCNP1310]MEA5420077.1 IscS subfamily cysteine desulfurase [Spirulina sp. CCNP1310]
MAHRPIYLDHHATTPVDPQVLATMLPYFTEAFGNPASGGHAYGWEAEAAVEKARRQIGEAINAPPESIIFTSGATEANNLAIKGIAEAYMEKGRHIITVQTEHRAILDPCAYLASLGFRITYLSVQEDGLINLEDLAAAIRPDTILVSIMAANNEIGVVQPLAAIGKLCHQRGVIFHTDAAQALGKIPLDVEAMQIDLMSLTAHKLYGPKGIGALYVRKRNPRVNLAPQLHGGGQEGGMRSGTLYTPQIVGFGAAVILGMERLTPEAQRLAAWRDRLYAQLQPLGGITLNGHPHHRLAGNLNITIEGVDGPTLLNELQPHIALSSGSACSSHPPRPSHVLQALGRNPAEAAASLRLGLGRGTTEAEIEEAIAHLRHTITTLRQSNPSKSEQKPKG